MTCLISLEIVCLFFTKALVYLCLSLLLDAYLFCRVHPFVSFKALLLNRLKVRLLSFKFKYFTHTIFAFCLLLEYFESSYFGLNLIL